MIQKPSTPKRPEAAKHLIDEDNVKEDGLMSLKDIASISKRAFCEALQGIISNPVYDRPTPLWKASFPQVASDASFRLFGVKHHSLPFTAAMLARLGIATHRSTSHAQLRSTICSL